MDDPEQSHAERASLLQSRWSSIEPGAELSTTVLFASGFALDEANPVGERYEVTERLGSGAMGQVLAVRVLGQQSQQRYALKLIAQRKSASERTTTGAQDGHGTTKREAATRWLTKLLRDEGAKQEAAQRHGVSVARFVALVRLDDGSLGLRMEIARGRSWQSLIDEERRRRQAEPDVHRAAIATRKLLGQLQRLHAIREHGAPSGFVHSDIKPSNVFVDESDPTDLFVTLLDFGVATAGSFSSGSVEASIGRETFVIGDTGGTHGYAPPGHFSAPPSPASDVHAAIVCFYELIALGLPWNLDEVPRTPGASALIERLQAAGPTAVRDRRPSISRELGAALDEFFSRSLSDLQSRAAAWSALRAASAGDASNDPRVAAMTGALATLATVYRERIDELIESLEARGLAPRRAPARSSYVAIERPRMAPSALASSADSKEDSARHEESTVVEGAGRDRSPRANEPADRDRGRAPRWWRSVAALVGLAAISVTAVVSLSAAVRRWPEAAAARSTSTPRVDAALSAAPTEPGVPLDIEPAVPVDVAALPAAIQRELTISLGSTAVRAPAISGDRRDGVLVPSAVVCVAPESGVRVVAHSGALERDVTLCTTDTRTDTTRVEFAGAGALDPAVLRALPTVQCIHNGSWLTRVRHFSVGDRDAWLFSCARVEAGPNDGGAPEAAL